VLARFGEAVKPEVRALRDAQAQELEGLVMRRSQLVAMVSAEKNRCAKSPKVIYKSIDERTRWLEKRLSGLDDELAGLVRDTPSGASATICSARCPGSARCSRPLC
jgi:transposase